jgi:nondiscriminating glutamyl-tRNA synthetase
MVVTRFAPSPTGFLHIGGVRSALYPYLLAKHEGGKFILRYEDTDRKRLVVEGYDMILTGLKTFGIVPDEIYKQSERLDLYKEYAEKLIKSGHAYYCFATQEELDAERKEAETDKKPFRYRSKYRDMSIEDAQNRIAKGEKYVIRLKLPKNETVEFTDELQGKMTFNTDDTDEGVLLKTDGYPTYHLAYIVDDFLMGVTHVFRGVEWLPSAVKHVIIYKALNIPIPKFYHMSLILDPEGGKLSKRKGAVAVHDFVNQGYLSEAMLNFVALLGWTPKVERTFGEKEREFYSMKDMIELFDTADLNKSSPVFNREKLIWFNQKYIQNLTNDELQKKFLDWVKETNYADAELLNAIIEKGPDFINKIMEMEKTRVKLISEIPESIRFYYFHKGDIDFSTIKQTKDLTKEQLEKAFTEFIVEMEKLNDLGGWTHEEWESLIRNMAEKMGVKAGSIFMAIRLAITDSPFTPPLFEILKILETKEIVSRLHCYV